MARVTEVKKARTDQGECKCGKEIKAGDPYRWAQPGFRGAKRVRCMDTKCRFRPSELTTSKLAGVYGATECAEDTIQAWDGKSGDVEDIKEALTTCAEEVREVAEEYRESAENMREAFNGNSSSVADECEEKADEISSWADELKQAAEQLEDFEHGDEREEGDPEAIAEERETWWEGVQSDALEALGNCPV